jgi:hypothetical protein
LLLPLQLSGIRQGPPSVFGIDNVDITVSGKLTPLPEKAAIIEPVLASFQKAFKSCDPVVEFASKTTSAEDSAKAAGRLKTECVCQSSRLYQSLI